jgi:hypothetical protein
VRSRSAVRRALRVELNPTVRSSDADIRFLASYNGREVFQRVGRVDVLDLVIERVRSAEGATLGSLSDRLVADPDLEATPDEATAYLESLLKLELLRFCAVVSDQEPDWDLPLVEFLKPIDDEHAQIITRMLREVRALLEPYADAALERRVELLAAMRVAIAAGLEAMGQGGDIPRDLPVFEDASSDLAMEIPLTDDLAVTLDTALSVGREMMRVSMARIEMAALRHFYDSRFGEAWRTPFLDYYEAYYRDHYRDHLDKELRIRNGKRGDELKDYNEANPFGLPLVAEIQRAKANYSGMLQRRWSDDVTATEMHLNLEEVRASLGPTAPASASFVSMAVFGQLILDDPTSTWRCILGHPSFFSGFGKYFSRFLYALPPRVLDDVREANRQLTPEILAEIAGDNGFNGNLHPPLLGMDISHPSGEVTSGRAAISVADIDVGPDAGDPHGLVLRRRSDGRRVHPIDLGFLNPMRRPPLFQLLSSFSPSKSANVPIPKLPTADVAASAGLSQSSVVYRPRIVIGGRVVIARRRWMVPGALFPSTKPGESAAEYCLRLDEWRRTYGIPDRVFARVYASSTANRVPAEKAEPSVDGAPPSAHDAEEIAPAADEIEAEHAGEGDDVSTAEEPPTAVTAAGVGPAKPMAAPQRRSRDYVKPQFIDFNSPLLIALFGRLAVGLPSAFEAAIEECYPDFEQLPQFQSDRYAAELVLQLDQREAAE